MFPKSCPLSWWNLLFGSFNENRFGAQLCVIHTITRYLYDSLSSLFEQIWEHFTVLTFAAMISDLPHFLLESSPQLRMSCCCKY